MVWSIVGCHVAQPQPINTSFYLDVVRYLQSFRWLWHKSTDHTFCFESWQSVCRNYLFQRFVGLIQTNRLQTWRYCYFREIAQRSDIYDRLSTVPEKTFVFTHKHNFVSFVLLNLHFNLIFTGQHIIGYSKIFIKWVYGYSDREVVWRTTLFQTEPGLRNSAKTSRWVILLTFHFLA